MTCHSLLAPCLVVCIAASPGLSRATTCLSPAADFNENGVTDVQDLVCHILVSLAILADDALPGCLKTGSESADLNCDDEVNVTDLLLTVKAALDLSWSLLLDADGNHCVDACEVDSDGDGVADVDDCEPGDSAVFPGAPELCNGADDNCNGVADEGIWCCLGAGESCASSGECCTGSCSTRCCKSACPEDGPVCNGGNLETRVYQCDNQGGCVYQITQVIPGGGECVVPGQQGACAKGTLTCSGTAMVCNQTVAAVKEICDAVDNDCDGEVDEEGVCLPGYFFMALMGSSFGDADETCEALGGLYGMFAISCWTLGYGLASSSALSESGCVALGGLFQGSIVKVCWWIDPAPAGSGASSASTNQSSLFSTLLPDPFVSDAFEDDECEAVGGEHVYTFPFQYHCHHGDVPIYGADMSDIGGWPECEDLGGFFSSTQDRCLTAGVEIHTAVVPDLNASTVCEDLGGSYDLFDNVCFHIL